MRRLLTITTAWRLCFTFAALLLAAAPLRAEQVVDLYTAEVLVATQSAADRERAAREAFAALVVRVSGDTGAMEQSAVREASRRAQDFVYEFNYASTDDTIEVDGEERPATRLVLKFSPVEIEQLLRSAELSLWPANRPAVLYWLVAREDDGARRVSGSQERDWLKEHALLRGLPLISPLDDLEDRLALSARQLWDLDREAIRSASARYDSDAVLVGRYSETSSGQWRSDWQLYHGMGNYGFNVNAESKQAMITSAVDVLADHFASLYAIVPREEGPDTLVLQLSNIEGFGAYKAAETYLEDLAMVRRVEMISVRPGVLLFRLVTEGDVERLLSTLRLDSQLVPAAQSGHVSLVGDRFQPQGTMANPLVYTWEP